METTCRSTCSKTIGKYNENELLAYLLFSSFLLRFSSLFFFVLLRVSSPFRGDEKPMVFYVLEASPVKRPEVSKLIKSLCFYSESGPRGPNTNGKSTLFVAKFLELSWVLCWPVLGLPQDHAHDDACARVCAHSAGGARAHHMLRYDVIGHGMIQCITLYSDMRVYRSNVYVLSHPCISMGMVRVSFAGHLTVTCVSCRLAMFSIRSVVPSLFVRRRPTGGRSVWRSRVLVCLATISSCAFSGSLRIVSAVVDVE